MKIEQIIKNAILEDMPDGDVTTDNLIGSASTSLTSLIVKEQGIISGIDIFKRVMNEFPGIEIKFTVENGEEVEKGKVIAMIEGNTSSILKGERIALNILQRMSGIATKTNKFVKEVVGNTKILDTRKTTPNFRVIEKLAVLHGGGQNHRFGLSDQIMIKDNHIKAVGSITKAVEIAKLNSTLKIEVEVESIEMFKEALETECDIIMLDNMSSDEMLRCVKLNKNKKVIEASGNMTLERIKEVSTLGVDYISVGELTHTVQSLDISLKFN